MAMSVAMERDLLTHPTGEVMGWPAIAQGPVRALTYHKPGEF